VAFLDLQSAFDATAKVLFGSPLGSLSDFEPWLSELVLPYSKVPSSISGKPVILSNPFYPSDARVVSQDELAKVKVPPFSPNEIKDIDSLFAAAAERAVFCGNKMFGRNSQVEDSDNAVDCLSIAHTHNCRNVKYGAYLSYMRESEHVFGCTGYPESRFCIRTFWGVGANRCFESYFGNNLSETYYCLNCVDCQNVMFGFNLRSKRHVIGGLQLSRERYMQIRQNLVSQMADELRRKKRIFSLSDIPLFGRSEKEIPAEEAVEESEVPQKVEQAFSSAMKLVLGKERKGIRKYSKWLSFRAVHAKKVKGAFNSPAYKPQFASFFKKIPADRLASLQEAMQYSEKNAIRIGEDEMLSLYEILSRVSRIAVFSFEFVSGVSDNVVDTPFVFGGSNIYRLLDVTEGKNSAYTTASVHSEGIFGGYMRVLSSQFCINCFDIVNCKGCFEVDSSYSCRNSYFCHNCENLSDSMFCFNAKAMQYAVCNTPVGKEEFLRLKKMLLDYLNAQLDKNFEVKESIFSIGTRKGR
jgi:hypothetical protein